MESLAVDIWRGGEQGRFERYRVPRLSNQTVLDVVSYVQQHLDSTLAYRFACRVGMCGSCTMTVNGVPRWTCRTHVERVAGTKTLTIEPLRNFPVIKDLVCDVSEFFDKLAQAGGYFRPTRTRNDELAVVPPDTLERARVDEAIECIGCGACYASCAVEAMDPRYLGPAALNRIWTLLNDVRDGAGAHRLIVAAGAGGCHSCKTLMSCTDLCPKRIPLTASIAGLKRATVPGLLGPGVARRHDRAGSDGPAAGTSGELPAGSGASRQGASRKKGGPSVEDGSKPL
ncbi:MAG: succinate dehydrogenase/fumarate reductase iron-sulfur subunit [Trueperaceae bacterium]